MTIKKMMLNAYNLIWENVLKSYNLDILDKRIKSISEDDNCIYYIISCSDKTLESVGLFGYINLVMQMINYAINHNMVPVVDMISHKNSLLEESEVGVINAWNLFFVPLQNRELDDVYLSGRYVIGNHMETDWSFRPSIQGYHRRDCYWHWGYLYKKFLRLSDSTQRYCDSELKDLLGEIGAENVLGVVARGTDLLSAKGHAIQPSVQQLIDKIKNVMRVKKFQAVYLATECEEIETAIRHELGKSVITNKRTYYDKTDYTRGLYDVVISGKTRYERNLEYLSSIYIVSNCGGLVAGNCGGSIGAYYMNYGKYRYTYFFELGKVKC